MTVTGGDRRTSVYPAQLAMRFKLSGPAVDQIGTNVMPQAMHVTALSAALSSNSAEISAFNGHIVKASVRELQELLDLRVSPQCVAITDTVCVMPIIEECARCIHVWTL